MFRLTTKLACSNLIKNRKLYYPFAIAVILAVTIAYLFDSLTFNPHIHELRGGDPMIFTLVLGLFVVNAAGAIIVLYANSFVMKNRSKELGIYSMLGLEKRHLISMIFKELLLFGFLTISAGVLIGALFDKLIFAFLPALPLQPCLQACALRQVFHASALSIIVMWQVAAPSATSSPRQSHCVV